MPNKTVKAPPVIAEARVIWYAVVDESVPFSGNTLVYVDGVELGRVPRLAVCITVRQPRVVLFYCTEDWEPLAVTGYESIAAAQERANRIYPGIASRWIETNFTEEDVNRFLDEMWGDDRCCTCGRRGDQVEYLRETPKGLICNYCEEAGENASV